MSLVTGTLVQVETGPSGTLRVGGALTRVDLRLVPRTRPGDTVIVESGVALSIVAENPSPEED